MNVGRFCGMEAVVRCLVIYPSLWPARWPATCYQTILVIQHVFDSFWHDLETFPFLNLLVYTAH